MDNIAFLEVIKANYLKDYQLLLEFNNGVSMVVDLSDSLHGTVFNPLKDMSFFRNFTIRYNTIEWPNGADFAPEYLYKLGIPKVKTDH